MHKSLQEKVEEKRLYLQILTILSRQGHLRYVWLFKKEKLV